MLSEVLLLRKQAVQAQHLVRDDLGLLGVDADWKKHLEDMMQRIVFRGDLYDRGMGLLPIEVLTFQVQSRPVLNDTMCQRVRRGIECLIRHRAGNRRQSPIPTVIDGPGHCAVSGSTGRMTFMASLRAHLALAGPGWIACSI